MEKIINHNCKGLCCERFCSNKEEFFMKLEINGLDIVMGFCKKHSEKFEDKFWKFTKVSPKKEDGK